MKHLATLLLLLTAALLSASNEIEFTPEGIVKFGGLEFWLAQYYKCSKDRTVDTVQRKGAVIPEAGYPKRENGVFRMKGTCRSRHSRIPVEKSFTFDLEIREVEPNVLDYKVRLFPAKGTWDHWFFLSAAFPVDDFSGREFSADGGKYRFFTETPTENLWPMPSRNTRELNMPCLSGSMTVRTDQYSMMVQDNRKWGGNNSTLRITFPKVNENEYGGTVRLIYHPPQTAKLDLRSVMNRGFADEVEGDGKGGWTDQGKENDFRIFPAGPMRCFGIPFDTIAPETNGGKSCLVMSGKQRPCFADRAELALPASAQGKRFLYLLHSAAWIPLGDVTGYLDVAYRDGSTETIPVRTNRDVANWWGNARLENAQNVWQKENRSAVVGLGMSCFELRKSDPVKLTFRRGNGPVWMILAATLADEKVSMRKEILPHIITSGSEYVPIEHYKPVKKDSILDFSAGTEKPAGKYGRVTASPDGRFSFADAPEKQLKLYGVNLCKYAAVLDRDKAELLADELSRMGYNSVRLHHIDQILFPKNVLNEKELDKVDYLISCLKKRGIYVTYDLFSARGFFNPSRPDLPQNGMTIRVLTPFDNDVFQNWADYAKVLLTHRNPLHRIDMGRGPCSRIPQSDE